jgi:hypothetical protein
MPVSPNVARFFDEFPAAHTAYAARGLFHLTHSLYLPSIQAEGLRPNAALFPENQGEFILDMQARYDPASPDDRAHARGHIQKQIIDPRRIYLSGKQPDMNSGILEYGIPERLMLLMRDLATLATKESLTNDEREFAHQALKKHVADMTSGNPSIVALKIDPLAPSVVNSRLGSKPLHQVTDEEFALEVVEYADGAYPNNIAIEGAIEPIYITTFGQAPTTSVQSSLASIYGEATWAAAIH